MTADTSPASLKSRTMSGVTWSFLDNISQQILSLVIFVILGRILSPALFGIVSTALVFVFLLRNTVLNSISTGLVMLRHPVDEDYDTGFWLCMIISVSTCFIVNLAAPLIANLYHIGAFEGVVRATSVILLVSGLSYAHIGWAKRNFLFRSLAMRNSISTGLAGIVGIVVAIKGYGITALVLNQVLGSILGLLLLWRAVPWRPKLRFNRARASAILATAVPLGANQTLQFLSQNFDTVLVTYLLGPLGGGLYAASKRIVLAVQIAVWQPMGNVALPVFAEVAHDTPRFNDAAVRIGGLVMATTAPLFAGLALTAPSAIAVLFGAKWANAAPTMTVLAAFGIIGPSLGMLQMIVIALKRSKFILVSTVLQMALSLVALYFWGRTGPVSVALCISAPSLIIYVVTIAFMPSFSDFATMRYVTAVTKPLICTAIMAVAVLAVPNLHVGALTQLAVMAIVGGLVYAAAAALILRTILKEIVGTAMQMWKKLRPAKAAVA